MKRPLNIIFVSPCNFRGNTAMHLFRIANILSEWGNRCIVCVPDLPQSALEHGKPQFGVLDYETILRQGVCFGDGRGPDLIHAWTPRELARRMTDSLATRYQAPVFVHLEDNELAILADVLLGVDLQNLQALPADLLDRLVPDDRSHPLRARQMLEQAAGVSVLIDRLLEHKPVGVPGAVFYPGYEDEFLAIEARDERLRGSLGVGADELLIVYCGNVHPSNYDDVRSVLLAVAQLNQRGRPTKLLKTGLNYRPLKDLYDSSLLEPVIDLGFVERRKIPQLLAAADVLVQPGQSSAFNDLRFPGKSPELLASGRPVIVGRTNVGLLLKDGEEALVLQRGDSQEIADALERLALDPDLRARLGRGGRAFAIAKLDWRKNVEILHNFYCERLSANAVSDRGGDRAAQKPARVMVSLVTVLQNDVHSIERTISSVNYQDWPAVEHIVMDIGSTDETIVALKQWEKRLTRVSAAKSGGTDAVNKGLQMSRGEIVGWLEAGEIYYPGAISSVARFFAANPDVDVAYGNADLVGDGDRIEPWPARPWDFAVFQTNCFIRRPAAFFRRSVIERYGLLDARFSPWIEYEYWLRLAEAGCRFVYLDRNLAASRMHAGEKAAPACGELNDMLVERLGFVPDSRLYEYADMVLGQHRVSVAGGVGFLAAREARAMLAALRWNGRISREMGGNIFKKIVSRLRR
ncbi:MAG: glycosyltransferase [Acidobacteriaceae bacterium]|nr:glycosyltransferase [Acidobacteriaceae bacterium]